MTPLEVLDAAFPWPGRTITTRISIEVAHAADKHIIAAREQYLNRMRIAERVGSL